MRRKFEAAKLNAPPLASKALGYYRQLFGIEDHLAAGRADLDSLLPDAWAESHPGSIRTYRQAESLARAAKTKARRALRRKQARR